ncbi:MAG: MBOAT family protein, partial [Candidatus Omnitrophica bacterium]|nr:MBOAT family protein [Candidatus Omnitrophota bacterium]
DIARGLGKLMGFEIMLNFNLPFFATNPQDFWNRWHISLSTWVKDYIYIPLFLSLRALKTNLRLYAALILSMLLLGLWHGAAWHFIVMGLYWGVVLVLYALSKPVFQDWFKFNNQALEKIWFWIRVVFMFHITVIGMVIFRVRSLTQAYAIVHALMFNLKFNHLIDIRHDLISMLGFIWVLVTVQLAQFINGDQ